MAVVPSTSSLQSTTSVGSQFSQVSGAQNRYVMCTTKELIFKKHHPKQVRNQMIRYFRELTDTLHQLYQMITMANNQQDVNHIKFEIERLLQQQQQHQSYSFPGEGNKKW